MVLKLFKVSLLDNIIKRRNILAHYRLIYSETGVWSTKLTTEVKKSIEKHWKDKINELEDSKGKEKFYVLAMFPYPSGNLHMGHVRVYTISDVIARFYRMNGKTVIHPIGWDAFGLPAENAAIEQGEHPERWTKRNIQSMKEQMKRFNYSFDWDREFATCDPSYYKWTQFLFLKMYEKRLAYQKEAVVNWDPVDLTVLADEQVDSNGFSWRSGAKVEKKSLKQWFFKATSFSKSLYDGLLDPTLVNWQAVRKVQQHWIGKPIGCHLKFKLEPRLNHFDDEISVWTNVPEAIYGASFITLSLTHKLVEKLSSDPVTERKLDVVAIHPLTKSKLPIFVSSNVRYPENCDSFLGIPSVCDEAKEFADKHSLSFIQVYEDELSDENEKVLVNSHEFSGLKVSKAKNKICSRLKDLDVGGDITSSKLKDWLISRQRYWGTPIPIVHCSKCKAVPVRFEDLPVKLPKIEAKEGERISLRSKDEWIKTVCPKCGGPGLRETDTMDTFVDSSWYFLRFLDKKNELEPFSKEIVDREMPVDIYIGGMEHAFLHLYYARFVTHFWNSLGLIAHKEPFSRLLVQGLVKGKTFRLKDSQRCLRSDEVQLRGEKYVEKSTGAEVVMSWEKMSKSKHNGVDPDNVIEEYGIDTARLFILANVAPATERNWSEELFPGVLNWQNKLWDLVTKLRTVRTSQISRSSISDEEFTKWEAKILKDRTYCVKKVNYGFYTAYAFNGAISFMQSLTNNLVGTPAAVMCHSVEFENALSNMIRLLAPMAPHFASELWIGVSTTPGRISTNINWDVNVLKQPWPGVD